MATDATLGKWQNFADDIFKERFDEQTLEEKKKSQFVVNETLDQKLFLFKNKMALKACENYFEKRWELAAKDNCNMYMTGGFGFAEMIGCPELEGCSFFEKGRMLKVNVCHGNGFNGDDASADMRLAFLKLRDQNRGEVFDLPMATGQTNMFYNLAKQVDFIESLISGKIEDWVMEQPANLSSLIGTLRRSPESYAALSYYCPTTFEMQTEDDVKLLRFRYYPMEEEEDESLLEYEEQKTPWNFQRSPNNRKDPLYLRRRFKQDVLQDDVHFLLQVQVTSAKADGGDDLYNTGIAWDVPWKSVAQIHITTPLNTVAASRYTFDINNRPRGLNLPSPSSDLDFRSSVTFIQVYLETHNTYNKKHPPKRENEVVYVVILKVADTEFAGTDSDVFLTLYGSKGKTSRKKLGRPFIDDFKKGSLDTYHFVAENVGVPLAVQFNLDKKWYCPWRFVSDMKVDYVTVLNTRQQSAVFFPYFSWVAKESVIPKAEVSRGGKKEPYEFLTQLRHYEVWRRRDLFRWKKNQGMPGLIDIEDYLKLPRILQIEPSTVTALFLQNLWRVPFPKPLIYPEFDSLGSYLTYAQEQNPDMSDTYSYLFDKLFDDKEFGRQFLVGIDPTVIERCTAVPENFALDADIVKDLMQRDEPLEAELKNGHVYIANFKHFAGIRGYDKSGEKRYLTSPMVLLYVTPDGDLIPIAIQLHQEPSDTNPVWTPKDSKTDWLFAKMWVRNAVTLHHLLCTVVTRGAALLESIELSLHRDFYMTHPIYQLLTPCVKNSVAISVIGRNNFLRDDGFIGRALSMDNKGVMEYVKRCYKTHSIYSLVPEKDMQARAVLNEDELPNYHWRRDSLAAWETVHKWVKDFLEEFYDKDEAVKDDAELQSWIKDIHENGFPNWEDDEEHGVPEQFEDLESLAEFVTIVMYTATFGYHALKHPTREYCLFIPNSPAAMMTPPPTSKGRTTMDTILRALPKQSAATEWTSNVLLRTRIDECTPRVTDHPEYFHLGEKKADFGKLLKAYKKLESSIEKMNKKLEKPYTYFLPENVPLCPYHI